MFCFLQWTFIDSFFGLAFAFALLLASLFVGRVLLLNAHVSVILLARWLLRDGLVFFYFDLLDLVRLDEDVLLWEYELGGGVVFGGEDIAGHKWIPSIKGFVLIATLLVVLRSDLRHVLDQRFIMLVLEAESANTYKFISFGFWILKSFTSADSSSSSLSKVVAGSSSSVEIEDWDIDIGIRDIMLIRPEMFIFGLV